jgi:choline dehydrogenase
MAPPTRKTGAPATLSRRGFAAAGAAFAAALGDCAHLPEAADDLPAGIPVSASAPVEYVVIGSGAGGGPLAANLARAGHRVVLMEAGGADDGPDYEIPAFHPLATEDPALSWAYYVRHYADQAQQERDRKFVAAKNGIFYPRSGTLGGCTAHHAMITITADAADWDGIADLTGDPSWRSASMRGYFQRLERCRYRGAPWNPLSDLSRHGYRGWLTTQINSPFLLAQDAQLAEVVFGAIEGAGLPALFAPLLASGLDPNDWRAELGGRSGIYNIPVSVRGVRRSGPREYIQATARALPDNLVIKTHALATRILFEGRRAVGVEYLEGAHLYRADPNAPPPGPEPAPRQHLRAAREVILAAGAFNSPQLLKLSGIGPRAELARFGIPSLVDLPGVGRNLQDRYEATVVTRMRADFPLLQACGFGVPGAGQPVDPCYAEWLRGGGAYATNGTVLGMIRRSVPARERADLFIFGIPGYFRGYSPGYSQAIREKDFFTWAILKAHTCNTAGTVMLRSADPRDTPDINFHYFAEGNDAQGDDLASVVAGIAYARRLNESLYRPGGSAAEEVVPGRTVTSVDAVARFVTDEAWGHHACGTCRIGPPGDPMAVVDSRFRVYGTQGLRIVDASVFPRIPGFFIVTPIYVISEKASDAILADARSAI